MRAVFTLAMYILLHFKYTSGENATVENNTMTVQTTSLSNHTVDQQFNVNTEPFELNSTQFQVSFEWTTSGNESDTTVHEHTSEQQVNVSAEAITSPLVTTTVTSALTRTPKRYERVEKYSEWSVWQCHHHCKRQVMLRQRRCIESGADDGKCSKSLLDMRADICYPTKCPTDCPDYKWGPNCNGSCSNCAQPCNKFTGICNICKAGFGDPKTSCLTELPVEPESGFPVYYLLIFLILVAVVIVAFFMCKGKPPVKKEGPKAKPQPQEPASPGPPVNEEAVAVVPEEPKVKRLSVTNAVNAIIKSLTPRNSIKEDNKPEPNDVPSRATSVIGVKGRV
ncbi:hypothetical protein Btru_014747 [Bulinus truncatus]|nr:hypothetical protein Btru_014747 [Bulinus truncatus]